LNSQSLLSQQQQQEEEVVGLNGKSRQNLMLGTKFRLFGNDLADDVSDVTSHDAERRPKTTSSSSSKPRGW